MVLHDLILGVALQAGKLGTRREEEGGGSELDPYLAWVGREQKAAAKSA
jgi:hypothetical protein